jgi:8-oxo-dGTP pyrophosphatase MutT (NUDIX family)/ribosomal protein S18 acetylase RimI-like enzyme
MEHPFTTLNLRRYEPADLSQVAAVFCTAWRNGFAGLVPNEALEIDPGVWGESKSSRLAREHVLVAERQGRIVGFAWLRAASRRSEDERVVELNALYTLPGEHAGMALLNEAVEQLEPHWAHMTLWSLDSNAAALGFYEARGFRPDGEVRDVEVAGTFIPHLRLQRPLTLRSEVRRRPAIRVLPRSPDGSILLMEHRNPDIAEPSIWLAPGGMPEGDESLEETARREFLEETGRELTEPLRRIWKRRHIYTERDEPVEAVETFFVADVPYFQPSREGFSENEKANVTQFRWWAPEELETTAEVIVPGAVRFAELLDLPHPIWVGR